MVLGSRFSVLGSRFELRPGLVAVASALLISACGEEEIEQRALEMREADLDVSYVALPEFNVDGTPLDAEVVVVSHNVSSAVGDVLSADAHGELTPEQRDRVARPNRFPDDPYIYIEEAWERQNTEAGDVESGYRVARIPNAMAAPLPPAPAGPAMLTPDVVDYLATGPEDLSLSLDIKVRGFPEWDIPLPPDPSGLSPEDLASEVQRRELAIEERVEAFDSASAPLRSWVESAGGTVLTKWWKIGWLTVELPLEAFPELSARDDVTKVDGEYGKVFEAGRSLGSSGADDYVGWWRHWDNGYDGQESNFTRHPGLGSIVIAMTEPDGYEESVCAFTDGTECTDSRIIDTFKCNHSAANRCLPGAVGGGVLFTEHGTGTTATLLGDYTDGQANGRVLGDPDVVQGTCTVNLDCGPVPIGNCESGACAHSDEWELDHTGVAPEAEAYLFGVVGSGYKMSKFTDMFDDAIDLKVDIANGSWTWKSEHDCDIDSNSILEEMVETAFDDGIFPVFIAGNFDGDEVSSCNVGAPGDTPKAFSVNAYDSETNDCDNFPNTRCLLDRNNCDNSNGDEVGCSARGGADYSTHSEAVSVIDLVAPNNFSGVTGPGYGGDGDPNQSKGVGTSFAAPIVAGSAAIVKDKFLNAGQLWINNPGRLHALMLHMGDRHFSTDPSSGTTWTAQLAATPDKHYGMGRLRLRLHAAGGGLAPRGTYISSFATSPASGYGFGIAPFGSGPLPAGIETVKCVLVMHEDMSEYTTIAQTSITMKVLPNTGSSCTGSPLAIRTSVNWDTKKLAAIENDQFSEGFEDNCIWVEVWIGAQLNKGSAGNLVCRYAGVPDDAAP